MVSFPLFLLELVRRRMDGGIWLRDRVLYTAFYALRGKAGELGLAQEDIDSQTQARI